MSTSNTCFDLDFCLKEVLNISEFSPEKDECAACLLSNLNALKPGDLNTYSCLQGRKRESAWLYLPRKTNKTDEATTIPVLIVSINSNSAAKSLNFGGRTHPLKSKRWPGVYYTHGNANGQSFKRFQLMEVDEEATASSNDNSCRITTKILRLKRSATSSDNTSKINTMVNTPSRNSPTFMTPISSEKRRKVSHAENVLKRRKGKKLVTTSGARSILGTAIASQKVDNQKNIPFSYELFKPSQGDQIFLNEIRADFGELFQPDFLSPYYYPSKSLVVSPPPFPSVLTKSTLKQPSFEEGENDINSLSYCTRNVSSLPPPSRMLVATSKVGVTPTDMGQAFCSPTLVVTIAPQPQNQQDEHAHVVATTVLLRRPFSPPLDFERHLLDTNGESELGCNLEALGLSVTPSEYADVNFEANGI